MKTLNNIFIKTLGILIILVSCNDLEIMDKRKRIPSGSDDSRWPSGEVRSGVIIDGEKVIIESTDSNEIGKIKSSNKGFKDSSDRSNKP